MSHIQLNHPQLQGHSNLAAACRVAFPGMTGLTMVKRAEDRSAGHHKEYFVVVAAVSSGYSAYGFYGKIGGTLQKAPLSTYASAGSAELTANDKFTEKLNDHKKSYRQTLDLYAGLSSTPPPPTPSQQPPSVQFRPHAIGVTVEGFKILNIDASSRPAFVVAEKNGQIVFVGLDGTNTGDPDLCLELRKQMTVVK